MATFLLTWELGGGLGHLTTLKPIAEELLRRGHEVHLALRDPQDAEKFFGNLHVRLWPAPVLTEPPHNAVQLPAAYVHLLHNCGFHDFGELAMRAAAWQEIFAAVRPRVAIFDYSPTALLAARGFDCRRVVLGPGFFCPPPGPTLPILRTWEPIDIESVQREESAVVDRVNRLLEFWRRPQLETLGQLYWDADDTALIAFEELDHFGPRQDARYWGVWAHSEGQRFEWPAGSGQRIFGYLRPSAALPALLQLLVSWRFPTIIYSSSLDERIVERYSSATLRFTRSLLDMRQVADECDLGIQNVNYATLATLLLAGKPSFLLPPQLEQYLLSLRMQQNGCCEFANPHDAAAIETGLRKMFDTPDYAAAAGRFAAQYAGYDPQAAVCELVTRLALLITG